MTTVLFAWELGANFGHLTRDIPVALALRAAGRQVVFAVRDMRIAAQLLSPHGLSFVPAPLLRASARLREPPGDYAELLLAEGYDDESDLRRAILGWSGLFKQVAASTIVADHAPTALLAAHGAGIPAMPLGTGFEIPPDIVPFPSMRPWEHISPARREQAGAVALDAINAALKWVGGRLLDRIGGLFPVGRCCFAAFPELDHYGARGGANYVGSYYSLAAANATSWPAGSERRVVAYLRTGIPGLPSLLAALRDLDQPTVCAIPGLNPQVAERISGRRLRVVGRPIAMAPLLAEADLAVSYSGLGFVTESLRSSTPVLAMPNTVEQYLLGLRLAELGGGVLIGEDRSRERLGHALREILDNSSYGRAATAFSDRYRSYSPKAAAEGVAAAVASLS